MPTSTSQFIFGNSLVNFTGGSFESNVPYWINLFYEATGGSYAANGGYGFLRDFASREVPANEWGFQGVRGIWDQDVSNFEDHQFDEIIITPGNFIQTTDPNANYAGDTVSPIDATVDTLQDVLAVQPTAQVFIYEGWSDLAEFSEAFPPSDTTLERYFAHNQEDYHDWYLNYVEELSASFPDTEITLIPVAPILTSLLDQDGPLSALTAEDLFVDTAPHGTETTYFLASLITFEATTGQSVPSDFPIPASIHPIVAENFEEIVSIISADTNSILSGPANEVVDDATSPGEVIEPAQDDQSAGLEEAPSEEPTPPSFEEDTYWEGEALSIVTDETVSVPVEIEEETEADTTASEEAGPEESETVTGVVDETPSAIGDTEPVEPQEPASEPEEPVDTATTDDGYWEGEALSIIPDDKTLDDESLPSVEPAPEEIELVAEPEVEFIEGVPVKPYDETETGFVTSDGNVISWEELFFGV